MTFWIINKIIAAYILSTLAFLIIVLFLKTQRRRTRHFLNKANLLIIFVLLLNLIFVGEQTIRCLVSENRNAKTIVSETMYIYKKNCTSIFIATFFFAFLFQSLFFFNRHRIKVLFTIISILLLAFVYNYERLVIYITSLYRDYLPSSWSTYYDWTDSLWTLFLALVYFAFCWTNQMTFKNKNLAVD
jgi:hypothetical protein